MNAQMKFDLIVFIRALDLSVVLFKDLCYILVIFSNIQFNVLNNITNHTDIKNIPEKYRNPFYWDFISFNCTLLASTN